jgi:hypothetical protein
VEDILAGLALHLKGRETSQDTASPIAKAYGIDG